MKLFYHNPSLHAIEKLLNLPKIGLPPIFHQATLTLRIGEDDGKYAEYVLSVLPERMEDKEYSFIEDLLPWSENLPEECRRLENQPSKK